MTLPSSFWLKPVPRFQQSATIWAKWPIICSSSVFDYDDTLLQRIGSVVSKQVAPRVQFGICMFVQTGEKIVLLTVQSLEQQPASSAVDCIPSWSSMSKASQTARLFHWTCFGSVCWQPRERSSQTGIAGDFITGASGHHVKNKLMRD